MATSGELKMELATTYGALSAFSYDGTYIWMTVRFPTANTRLYRFSPSLKKFIKPDGSAGDYTNAYVDLGAAFSGAPSTPISNGTMVVVTGGGAAPPASCLGYRCTDMAYLGGYPTVYNSQITSGCRAGFTYGGDYYYPGWDGAAGAGVIWRLTPQFGSSRIYTSTFSGVSAGFAKLCGTKVLVGMEPVNRYLELVNIATWGRIWMVDLGAGKAAIDATYDVARDEVWVSVVDGECIRLRGSDGAILNRDATVGTYASALIVSANDSLITQGAGVLVNGSDLWAGGSGGNGFRLSRRSTSPDAVTAQPVAYSAKSTGHWICLPNHPNPQLVIGDTTYFAIGGPIYAQAWTAAAVGWVVDAAPGLNAATVPSPSAGNFITVSSSGVDALGSDVSTYPDLDPNFGLQGGNRVVAEVILRMLETPRGSLVYAPDRGFDLRGMLNESITDRVLAQVKRGIENECLKDERVDGVTVALSYDSTTSTLKVRLEVTTADGPFHLTLAVTSLSISILDEGA